MRDAVKDGVSNELYGVVRSAIWAGITPDEFRRMAAECWENALDDEKRSARQAFAERSGARP